MKKIPVLFSRPKKIPASFIDPKKSVLAKMSDPKKSFGPPSPPPPPPRRTVLSPRFLYYSSLMNKRYLAMWIWLCEDKLKVKVGDFRLPSASQKRACLSSLSKYVSGAPGHVNLHCVPHNISQFSLPVCCRFMYGKVLENVEALLSLFSKYKLFVYGIELWTQKRHVWFISCLIYVGLNLPL